MENRPPELLIKDPESLVGFYESVFGWRVLDLDPETGNWTIYRKKFSRESEGGETIVVSKVFTESTSVIGSFEVDDLDETTQRVFGNGGTVYRESETGDDDIIEDKDGNKLRFFCDPKRNMFAAVELKEVPPDRYNNRR
jgi:predicted enzyme related to lactoylglutathione lyase